MYASIVVLGMLLIASSGAARAATITEFSAGISASSGPAGITAGPDGNLWFTESAGTRVARITPAGSVTEFSAGISAGSGPSGIAAGPDGNLWFTETAGRVARITTAGVITEFSAGITAGSNPWGITAGPDGHLWFTEATGNRVARATTAGVITEFPAGGNPSYNRPSGITLGPDGSLWFVDPLDQAVARVSPAGGVTRFPAAFGNTDASIAAGPDGNLWFSLSGAQVGRMTPSGALQGFSTGITPGSGLAGIAAGPDGNLWLAAAAVDRVVRITPTGVVTEFSLGITPGSRPTGIAAGSDGNIWFTESGGHRIGRLKIEPPAAGIGDARGVGLTEATITGSVNPRSDPSTYFFEYGTTTGYGSQTSVQSAGAGATAGEVSAVLTGLAPETTYHYRLQSRNAGGLTATTPDRTFTTAANLDRDADGVLRPADCDDANAAIKPGAPELADNGIDENCDGADAVNLDRDGDGFARPLDCDDGDAAVHPGAIDVRGNGADEDCAGGPEPFPRITSGVPFDFNKAKRGRTKVVFLAVRDAPVGSTIRLRCRGGGCKERIRPIRGTGLKQIPLTRHFKRPLQPKAVIEIRITAQGMIGKYLRFTMRRGKLPRQPTIRCIEESSSRLAACPAGS